MEKKELFIIGAGFSKMIFSSDIQNDLTKLILEKTKELIEKKQPKSIFFIPFIVHLIEIFTDNNDFTTYLEETSSWISSESFIESDDSSFLLKLHEIYGFFNKIELIREYNVESGISFWESIKNQELIYWDVFKSFKIWMKINSEKLISLIDILKSKTIDIEKIFSSLILREKNEEELFDRIKFWIIKKSFSLSCEIILFTESILVKNEDKLNLLELFKNSIIFDFNWDQKLEKLFYEKGKTLTVIKNAKKEKGLSLEPITIINPHYTFDSKEGIFLPSLLKPFDSSSNIVFREKIKNFFYKYKHQIIIKRVNFIGFNFNDADFETVFFIKSNIIEENLDEVVELIFWKYEDKNSESSSTILEEEKINSYFPETFFIKKVENFNGKLSQIINFYKENKI